ncbi:small multi-drug export protein [Candidatus Bathyarchaeota archaeon]|nr:small multi-drug export protein [Candidatus Bathyarchaeota archaeon]
MERAVDLISKLIRQMSSQILILSERSKLPHRIDSYLSPLRDNLRSRKTRVESTFHNELNALRNFFQQMTFLSLTLAFMIGLILGGILSSEPAVFIILTLALGFPVAIAYGSVNGVSPILSTFAAVFVNCLMAYASLRIIRLIEADSRIAPYVDRIRSKYTSTSRRLLSHAGRFGVAGSLAIFAFLIGWWVAAVVAYILDVEMGTAMRGMVAGTLVGGFTSLAMYQGLLVAVPNPGIISLIFVTVFVVSAYLTRRAGRRKKNGTA